MNMNKQDPLQNKGEEGARRALRTRKERDAKAKAGQRRWLFILVDVVLLAVIVASVFFLVTLLTPFSIFRSGRDEVRDITYTIELRGLTNAEMETLRAGDVVTDLETGAEIGVITEVHSRPYTEYTDKYEQNQDPKDPDKWWVVQTEYPDGYKTVTLTVTVSADYQKGVGYSVSDSRIAVGHEFRLSFPKYTGKGVCVELKDQ